VEVIYILPCNLKTCIAELHEGAMKTFYVIIVVFSICSNLTTVYNMGHIYSPCRISLLENPDSPMPTNSLIVLWKGIFIACCTNERCVWCVCILICFPFFLYLIQFRPYLIRVTNTCSYRHKSQMQAYLKTYTTYSTNCSLLVFILLRGAQVMHTNCKILQQVWVVRLHGTLTAWTQCHYWYW